jgi:hypothetical protein
MKSIKYYALGLLSAAFLTVAITACSNEEPTNMQADQSSAAVPLKSGDEFTGGPVAKIVNGDAVPLYNADSLKVALVSTKFFSAVESIEVTYGVDPATNDTEAFMTIIGIEPGTSAMLVLVADLKLDGDQLLIPNPETNVQAFATHTCKSVNCSQCNFKKQGLFGRIVGCEPCGGAAIEGQPAGCEHSVTSGGGNLLKVVLEIVKFAAMFL